MPKILIPTPLRQYAGNQSEVEVSGATVGELLDALSRQHAELRRMTVLEYAPDSEQAGHYRSLAHKIHANGGKGIIPTPITMDELEDMLMEHGIMKAVDESMVGKSAAELALG